jgi:hypothetical protein
VVVCRPADPGSRWLVERANGYLETSFLPGRRFASAADFNAQLAEWTALFNTRVRRAPGCAPADRIAADRHAMLALPPVAPETGWRASLRDGASLTRHGNQSWLSRVLLLPLDVHRVADFERHVDSPDEVSFT